jgi:TRAP-type C4-dicarboxylate transport system substrate-binding protein
MSAIKAGTIVVALSLLIAAACTSTSEEPAVDASPTSDPIVLRLGTGDPLGRPDTPVVGRFANAVEELSDGRMRVEVVWEAAGSSDPPNGHDQGVVGLVQDRDLDLGWVAARTWDTMGVTSFQALQAPFLITDQELLAAVLASPMAAEMMTGLDDAGVVGLGMYPDGLRYPLGYAAPIASLEDFDGAAIRLVPSEATDSLIRALGGRPVYGLNGDELDAAIAGGDIDGTEISLALAPTVAQDVAPRSVVTGNVVLFPRVNTLFAGRELMATLSDEQQAILAAAAEEAQAVAAELATEDVQAFCDAGGEIVHASRAEVAAMERAAQPVYGSFEADPTTKSFIEQIRELKEGLASADAPPSCPAG